MELYLDRQGDGPEFARVTKQLKEKDGRPIGAASKIAILDYRMYEVEYEDGHKVAISANAISSNLFVQLDQDGQRCVLFDEIIIGKRMDHILNRKTHSSTYPTEIKEGVRQLKAGKYVSNGSMGSPHGIRSRT